ncbi:hypothetical protein GGI43DRAFT_387499 [Trichoderma evansii]
MSSTAFRRSATLNLESDQATQPSSPPTEPPSNESNDSFFSDEAMRSLLNPSPPSQYPLSHQVLNLERREREAQLKCERLEEKCRELSLALDRMAKEKHEMEASYEARCQLAEVKAIAVNKQLKKERDKVEELNGKNENLITDLAAASEKNTFTEKMLEEKTHESYIFRCAYRVVFKCSLSIKEKSTIRGVLTRVINRRRAERRKEIEAQANRDRNQNDEERQLDSSTLESSSNLAAVTEAADSNSRRRYKQVSSDSDDEMPLFDVRKKRAKKA